jgi:hypothetical protein
MSIAIKKAMSDSGEPQHRKRSSQMESFAIAYPPSCLLPSNLMPLPRSKMPMMAHGVVSVRAMLRPIHKSLEAKSHSDELIARLPQVILESEGSWD